MRKYVPKGSVQKKAKYTDRYWVAPRVPRLEVEDEFFKKTLENLANDGVEVKDSYVEIDHLVIEIDAKDNVKALTSLRDSSCYKMCVELSAVDYLAQDGEFEIFYLLLNHEKAKRVRVDTRIKEGEAIESVEKIYRSANFAEREMFDMYGIVANNHSYLKRILMPDDWVGHPLLKTYPLQGDEAASWYEVDKIFGKEYRDIIGPELRDPAKIDTRDTQRFARVGKEVPFGADPELVDGQVTPIEDRYSKTILTDYTTGSEQLDNRR